MNKKGDIGGIVITIILILFFIFLTIEVAITATHQDDELESKDKACQEEGFDSWESIKHEEGCLKGKTLTRVELECEEYNSYENWCEKYELYYIVDGGEGK